MASDVSDGEVIHESPRHGSALYTLFPADIASLAQLLPINLFNFILM
jgi:hypothetical protein